jgi:DNA invertase Pin-like site-specific DNA recombinase
MMAEQVLVPYLRQSRKKEKTISFDQQREAIERWAKFNDVTLGAEVVEQGVSGSKSWKERELGAAIKAVAEGRAQGIVCAFQDRLSREQSLGTAEVWEALDRAGARLVCAGEGLDTAAGGVDEDGSDMEMLFTIKAAVARKQWRRFQKNWQFSVDKGIARGAYVGMAPVGFDRVDNGCDSIRGTCNCTGEICKTGTLVKNAHAPAVAEAFRIRANHGSWQEAAVALNKAGVPTATGQTRWSITSVRSLVENSIYKGELHNGHTHFFPEYVVVSPTTWKAAQPVTGLKLGPQHAWKFEYDVKTGITKKDDKKALAEAARRRAEVEPGTGHRSGRKSGGTKTFLASLVFCGNCGRRLTPVRTSRGEKTYLYLQCRNVGACEVRANVLAKTLEDHVLALAVDYYATAIEQVGITTGRDSNAEKVNQLEAERDEAKRRLAAFVGAVDPTDPGFAERVSQLREALQAAEGALLDEQGTARVTVTLEQFQAALSEATNEEKRQLLRKVVERVTVWREGSEPTPVFEISDPLARRVEIEYVPVGVAA